jgi:methionyl-tRNA formyltransferase
MRLVMMGTGTFAEPTFEALLRTSHTVVGLVTQPDRAAGAERGSTRQTGRGMKTIALEHQLPVLQPESINTAEGVAALKDLQPDLLVVAAYGQILSNDVLAVAPRGGINVHASLLPKYRGAAPIAWALYHGETKTGVTIIQMSIHLDAGAMLARESVAIGPEETAGELESRLAALGAKWALEVIGQIESGTTRPIVQDKTQATKAPKLTKEHGLIDWNRPARAVCNQIRAMQPWPTAYTFFHRPDKESVRVMIARAIAHDQRQCDTVPGTVIVDPDQPGHLWIATAEPSMVEVLELQPAGKRRMSAADFLRGHALQPGDRFGPETGA